MGERRIWVIFSRAFAAIRRSHEMAGLTGHHDINHAARVGDTAYRIAFAAWGDETRAQLAGLAGLCHNADRILEMRGVSKNVVKQRIAPLVEGWFRDVGLSPEERARIQDAVLRHDQKNDDRDDEVLVALMDADRVINMDPDVVMRSGQLYANLPAVDFRHFLSDPAATYRDPRSVLKDVSACLDWVDPKSSVCIRTKPGLAMAQRRAEYIRAYIEALRNTLLEEEMLPVPF